ncbi:MAG: TIGR04053 family radical SAM/SPASM domain-containing protein [Euryarchaeota archaeon]|nr:TIGR04053 family radical SAM/SPASM domain-containing protein [Euryarchaeota archaeon]MDE1880053.1 TIGR04053 family radical SAM/SPASM domain-containing protein [Euryarchaeota archaeon]MDE2045737.1 TIGR04053 family radical SAM/SPASM domain-containing protein [Thermoplasmata archaeon]
MASLSSSDRPHLVFWETTRACGLSCVHCRASAMPSPQPGELSPSQGLEVIDAVASFGAPVPVLVFTGGDPLRRPDLFELLAHARERSVPFAVAPAVTDLLDARALERLSTSGASSISLSLDGALSATHDGIRGAEGSFDRTMGAVRELAARGARVQVNSVVMPRNLTELPKLFQLVRGSGASVWEVFFLVRTGRGAVVEDLPPDTWEEAAHFLLEASRYGTTVRAIEAPIVRRLLLTRDRDPVSSSPEKRALVRQLHELLGPPPGEVALRPSGTLDGDGTLFVAHDGSLQPGGLLPHSLGRLPGDDMVKVYRHHPLLRAIRERRLHGPCGYCSYRTVCGGSRARAFTATEDPLGTDPACLYGSTALPPLSSWSA